MLRLGAIDHIAIICSDYEKSKKFYVETLGLKVVQETYREERKSYKLDLALNEKYIIELFSFPNPPARTSSPEARGLRHLVFQADDLDASIKELAEKGIVCEEVRFDETRGNKRFTFFSDPDGLPLELCEK